MEKSLTLDWGTDELHEECDHHYVYVVFYDYIFHK